MAALAAGFGSRLVHAAGMHVYVQWALASPSDWTLLDTGNWPNRQTKDDPIGDVSLDSLAVGDALLDNKAGWVFDINCQGVTFGTNDHVAVEPHPSGGAVITVWNDDPIWYPLGWRYADVWTFEPLQFDPRVGTINTKQSRLYYAEPMEHARLVGIFGEAPPWLRMWEELAALPQPSVTKHGIWLSDALSQQHLAAQTQHGWREWSV